MKLKFQSGSLTILGLVLALVALFISLQPIAKAQGPEEQLGTNVQFVGRLTDDTGNLINDTCDFEFKLYRKIDDTVSIGTHTENGKPVTDGIVIIDLEFGNNVFNGQARYLESTVNCGAGRKTLAPRQALNPVPHALALPGLWTKQNFPSPNLIGGYRDNQIPDETVGATIGGGGSFNEENQMNSFVDGFGDLNPSNWSTIGGGQGNNITGQYATVSGGGGNTISGSRATISGGRGNEASGIGSTISGGVGNRASGSNTTISGGRANEASGPHAVISGGEANNASGQYATISGGQDNVASGDYSFAAGRFARANHKGAYVWADTAENIFEEPIPYASDRENQFKVRATGGVRFDVNGGWVEIFGSSRRLINTSVGGYLGTNGVWSPPSDRNVKKNLVLVDQQKVLAQLTEMPIYSWTYKNEDPSIRHIGPMAQDFYSFFKLGDDNLAIGTVDADGVALAAIQGLSQTIQEQKAQLTTLQQQNTELESRIIKLEKMLESLELDIGEFDRSHKYEVSEDEAKY